MDVILVAGLWLPRSVWGATAAELERLGHRPRPVALPGVDDGDRNANLDDQLAAVLAEIDDAADPCLVVGHSAAATLAWLAADRRPDAVAAAVLIGGFPSDDGSTYAEFFPIDDGVMAFPGWEPFDGPDGDDLDPGARDRIAAASVAVPAGVARGVVRYGDERRRGVPAVVVCPEFSPDEARSAVDGGHAAELAAAEGVTYLDIDSGHWPMETRPVELAGLLDRVARGEAGPNG